MSHALSELLTRVFQLLERSSGQLGCGCGGHLSMCLECQRLQYDLKGLLENEMQGERP